VLARARVRALACVSDGSGRPLTAALIDGTPGVGKTFAGHGARPTAGARACCQCAFSSVSCIAPHALSLAVYATLCGIGEPYVVHLSSGASALRLIGYEQREGDMSRYLRANPAGLVMLDEAHLMGPDVRPPRVCSHANVPVACQLSPFVQLSQGFLPILGEGKVPSPYGTIDSRCGAALPSSRRVFVRP